MKLLIALLFITSALTGSEALPRFAVRDGLPHAAAKLAAGEAITIAFLGGSITKGGGKDGFSAAVPRWLQQEYPKATVTTINAGINGTDSGFGAARTDRDLIAHEPDVVVVEFAVNDGTSDRSTDMERIVRKLWTADPSCDIVFIYTVAEDQLEPWKRGALPPSAAAHERVAAFYGIPSVGLGVDLLTTLNQGATWKQLMRDGCHPTAAGYAVYVTQITDAVQAALRVGTPGRTLRPDTLKPGLVLRPAPKAVTPLPEPEPLVTADGRTAQQTWQLPTVGEHWRQEPEFRIDGKALWSLHVQPWKSGTTRIGGSLDNTFGLSRAAWQPMGWLEERSTFDGPEGLALMTRTTLSARENDLPVVAFVAPETGRYAFHIQCTKIRLWSHHKRIGVNMVHFPWGKDDGHSVAFATTDKTKTAPLNLHGEVDLVAGEILAACLDADVNYGGGGATAEGFAITVGLLTSSP